MTQTTRIAVDTPYGRAWADNLEEAQAVLALAKVNRAHEGCTECRNTLPLMDCKPRTWARAKWPTLEYFVTAHPVARAMRTGLWGWQRIGDSINLNCCTYPTEQSAEIGRKAAYGRMTARGEEVAE